MNAPFSTTGGLRTVGWDEKRQAVTQCREDPVYRLLILLLPGFRS